MESSSLRKLPAELRNTIFELALSASDPVNINLPSANRTWTSTTSSWSTPSSLAHAQTCKQIRRETLPVFFAANSFSIVTSELDSGGMDDSCLGTGLKPMRRLLAELGTHKALISTLEIHLGYYEPAMVEYTSAGLARLIRAYRGLLVRDAVKLTVDIATFCDGDGEYFDIKLPMFGLARARENVDGLPCRHGRCKSCGYVRQKLNRVIDRLEAKRA
ncbi:hypothetical protein LTR85_008777 [Meristemomyces frigidus]|nr:hypothetical protein LTR85_008777 [Meristemomyces frigidus]